MLILAGTLLALLLVPVLGGRVGRMADLGVVRGWLVPLALATQVLIISIVPTWPHLLLVVLHGLSYVLAGAFVWCNRRVPGLLLLALGAGMNALAIAANGGQMPASPDAVRRAGLPLETEGFVNSGVVADPRLAWLGDVFASPSWLPLQNVYSLGDLVILAGAAWAVHRTCGTVLARDPRPLLLRWCGGVPADLADRAEGALSRYEEVCRERDEALRALREAGDRADAMRREIARLRQEGVPAPRSPQERVLTA